AALPTPLPAPVMIAVLLMNASPGTRKSAHGNAFRSGRRPSARVRRAAPPGAIPGVPRAPACVLPGFVPHGAPGVRSVAAAPAARAAAPGVPGAAAPAAAPQAGSAPGGALPGGAVPRAGS